MWSEDLEYPGTRAARIKLRVLVEFFVWLLTAPMTDRHA